MGMLRQSLHNGIYLVGTERTVDSQSVRPSACRNGKRFYAATCKSQTIEQVDAGAEILDVNAGLPQIDETQMLTEMVKYIQSLTDAPLQIDCGKPEAIERVLREVRKICWTLLAPS